MRVVVPFADGAQGVIGKRPCPETVAALAADGQEPEYVDVGRSQTAYFELFERLWREGSGWVNVEHDLAPWPGALQRLWECPCDFGGYAYNIGNSYGAYLGCTKFSDALVRERPGVMQQIDQLPYDGTGQRYWGRLDTRLIQVLEGQGVKLHVHWPAIPHYNPQKVPAIVNCRCGAPIPEAVVMSGPGPHQCLTCST